MGASFFKKASAAAITISAAFIFDAAASCIGPNEPCLPPLAPMLKEHQVVETWSCGMTAAPPCEDGEVCVRKIDPVSCTLHEDGTFYVSGTGAMQDYNNACNPKDADCEVLAPWHASSYKDMIKTVVVSDGVTDIGNYAFYDLPELTSVTFGASVNDIGYGSLYETPNLTSLTIYNPQLPDIKSLKMCASCPPGTEWCRPCPNPTFNYGSGVCLYVPAESVDLYTEAGQYNNWWNCVEPIPTSSVRRHSMQSRAAAARVTVRNRTLTIKPSAQTSALQIRLIDMRGKSAANFAASGSTAASFSLASIPAGRYFVEVRDGVNRERVSVIVGIR